MLNKFKVAFVLSSVIASTSAMAISDNTITFKGEVSTVTCEIAVNGNNAKPVVVLPTVSTTVLGESGKTAGATTFDIGLTNCPVSESDTKVSTIFVANSATQQGNLTNTGTAKNVEIQILTPGSNATAINFAGGYKGDNDITITKGDTSGSVTYTAQYYAVDAATAGTVESTLQYAVSYQ